uniref:Coiled-coil domain-containing protein 51 n=1 Tax=Strigamia maritima TaxID=126957 RepID=T1IJL4_STRMM
MMAAWRAMLRVRLPILDNISRIQRRTLSLSNNSKSITVAKPIVIPEKSAITKQFLNWLRQYEDFVGLSEVREAQNRAQKKFMDTQEARRDRQRQIQEVQQQLKTIHAELDKTSRGEDRYLHLITQEHAIIKQEKQFIEEFQTFERAEREYFSLLSNSVRTSHEKERAQAEKTKYWSIIGSVSGAIIGIVATTLNNWLRMRELRGIVSESSGNGSLNELLSELSDATKNQHNLITLFLADLKSLLSNDNSENFKRNVLFNSPNEQIEVRTNELLDVVKRQESTISNEMKEIKSLILAKDAAKDAPAGTAIYIGRDVEQLMKEAEQNIEYKIKLNALGTVITIYAILALTVPIIFKAFGGG